jgi:hypothetical protein
MDDELKQLEAELKQLKPALVSRRLTDRIEADLRAQPEAAPRRSIFPAWWIALPIAAAVALAFTPLFRKPASTPMPPASASIAAGASGGGGAYLKPIAAEKLLVSADDEGLVTLDDGTPARRERLQYVDTITWKNPRTNASLKWTVPREEVRVVPIAFQ